VRGLLLILLSGVVLLSAPLVFGVAIWLVVLGWPSNFFAFLGAAVLLALALLLRPRPYRVRRPDRSTDWQHPRLHGLAADVCRAVEVSPPSVLAVNGGWTGFAVRSGLLQRRTLVLGLPLLAALPPLPWVALIAREASHLRAGRALRLSLARLALDTLAGWIGSLAPTPESSDPSVRAADRIDYDESVQLADFVSRTLGRLLALGPLAIHGLLTALTASYERASALDGWRTAAQIAGTEAALDLLAHERAKGVLDDAVHRVAGGRTPRGLFDELRRRAREAADRHEAGDPASARLRETLRERPVTTPRHRLSAQETDAILRELDDVGARVERELVEAYRYEWQQY